MTNPKTSPVAGSVVELKPCPNPWCAHNQPDIIQWGHAGLWRVQCDCGIYPCDSSSEAEAIKLWNTRPIEDETSTDAGEGVEPVAYCWERPDFGRKILTWPGDAVPMGWNCTLLYAHPTPTDTGLVGELVEALEQCVRALALLPENMRPDCSGAWSLIVKAKDTHHG